MLSEVISKVAALLKDTIAAVEFAFEEELNTWSGLIFDLNRFMPFIWNSSKSFHIVLLFQIFIKIYSLLLCEVLDFWTSLSAWAYFSKIFSLDCLDILRIRKWGVINLGDDRFIHLLQYFTNVVFYVASLGGNQILHLLLLVVIQLCGGSRASLVGVARISEDI